MDHIEEVDSSYLQSLIERAERLEDKKRSIADDLKSLFAEAKADGYDPKIMKEVMKARQTDQEALDEHQSLFDTYMNALD